MVTSPNVKLQSQEAEISDKIARLLRSPEGKIFMQRLEERRTRCYGSLRENSELLQIGRSQGRVDILDWILSMRGD